MTELSDLEPVSSTQHDDGRARRGKILLGIGVAVVVAVGVTAFVANRGADDRMVQLEADLQESFAGMTRSDVSFVDLADASSTDMLVSNGGVEPNLVSLDGDILQARYGYDFMGSRNCIRVRWTPDDVSFERGEGAQCTTPLLN